MNEKKNLPLGQTLLHTCAWCARNILPESETYGFGAKARKGLDLKDKEGKFVSLVLALEEKTVVALVTANESQAQQEGYDLVFITCSHECAQELKYALELEIEVFEENC